MRSVDFSIVPESSRMQNLIRFLTKSGTFLLFVLLQGISIYLLVTGNRFQQSVVFSSANQVAGKIYEWRESLTVFFSLKSNNEALMRENNDLLVRIHTLEEALSLYSDDSTIPLIQPNPAESFRLIPARVHHYSTAHLKNFITLNVGSKDGVQPEMGVANADGIVGVVSRVSDHYSVVIPVINPQIVRFSCKLKSSNTNGSLVWDGVDKRFAFLEEVPPYVPVSKGDTVVTSGYSDIFPEGIAVGIVEDYYLGAHAKFLHVKVRLSVKFDALSNVRVIDYIHQKEMKRLIREAEL